MKFIKLYESFDDIDSICTEFGINKYTINSDGTIDVDDSVYLFRKGFTKLPLKFGKVSGNFNCSQNQLTSLEGCPRSVGGYFDCSQNKLTTLEFCPQSVGRHFDCSTNNLKDLYGFPEFLDYASYFYANPVYEILLLFNTNRLGKVIDLLNEYGVIQQDGNLVILDRLEEIFYTLNMEVPKEINLKNYEVY